MASKPDTPTPGSIVFLNPALNSPDVRASMARESFDVWPQTPGQSESSAGKH